MSHRHPTGSGISFVLASIYIGSVLSEKIAILRRAGKLTSLHCHPSKGLCDLPGGSHVFAEAQEMSYKPHRKRHAVAMPLALCFLSSLRPFRASDHLLSSLSSPSKSSHHFTWSIVPCASASFIRTSETTKQWVSRKTSTRTPFFHSPLGGSQRHVSQVTPSFSLSRRLSMSNPNPNLSSQSALKVFSAGPLH